ncbi:MAG: family 10 glycosylhydrolase [Chthonomonas sp.]|nr:family 10 glycosylhydrolase [Chthonomonas sp.]
MLGALLGIGLPPVGVENRFEFSAPFPNLPAVKLDKIAGGIGVAQQMARSKGWQARMLWVDTTANLGNYNTEDKVIALVDRAHRIGFNTVVFDVKPIIGYTIYPSAFTEQLTQWRTHSMPAGYDPVAIMLRECHKRGLKFFVCLNALSEGHQIAKNQPGKEFANGKGGPGYDMPEMQSVQYRPVPRLRIGTWSIRLAPQKNSLVGGDAGLYDTKPPSGHPALLIQADKSVASYHGEALKPGERVLVVSPAIKTIIPSKGLASMVAEPRFLKSSEEQNQVPLMMNPHDPRVRKRAIGFVKEILGKYAVDGILYDDRLRFTGMDGDFSDLTRAKFERLVGAKLNWPKDVFETTYNWDMGRGVRPGRYWDAWWTFRAREMKQWVYETWAEVNELRIRDKREIAFGIYAGSWYGEYDNYGANYGSPEMTAGFPFLTRAFRVQGFADYLDLFIAGCYYPVATIFDAMISGRPEGRTVEAASIMANRVINDDAWTIAGVSIEALGSDPVALQNAIQAAAASSQGVMVFDNSHRIERFEADFAKAFAKPAVPPYAKRSNLEEVKRLKATRRAQGVKDPPIFIYPGAPGAGF